MKTEEEEKMSLRYFLPLYHFETESMPSSGKRPESEYDDYGYMESNMSTAVTHNNSPYHNNWLN